jgi:hypothetical protein
MWAHQYLQQANEINGLYVVIALSLEAVFGSRDDGGV